MQNTAASQEAGSDTPSLYKRTVILDPGSDTLRAGFGGQERPSVMMPSIIGRPKDTDMDGTPTPGNRRSVDTGKEEVFVGEEVLAKNEVLRRSYPVFWGLVQNFKDLMELWKHVFEEELEIEMEDSPLVVMESAYMVPKITREKQTEMAFETFNVPAFYLAPAAPAVLNFMGTGTGLVIDIGRNNVRTIPVYEGYSLLHAVMKFEFGGECFTDTLHKLLTQKGFSLVPPLGAEEVRRMKEKLAYFAQDFKQEKETFGVSHEKSYTLPNGEVLTVGKERFQCVEPLFQPSMVGLESPGLVDHVVMTVSKCESSIRQRLFSNVVLAGGGSMVPGLAKRLQQDVQKELGSQGQSDLCGLRVQVQTPPDGDLIVWKGGSLLSCSTEFAKMCISKEEYDEYGSSLIHQKCY